MKKYLTISEIAKKAGISRQRVHQIINEKKIPVYRRTLGRFLIDRNDIKFLIELKRVK